MSKGSCLECVCSMPVPPTLMVWVSLQCHSNVKACGTLHGIQAVYEPYEPHVNHHQLHE